MTATKTKPIRQCLGCALNLGKECAVFDDPALKWHKRKCEGYNSPAHMALYEKLQHPEGALARKRARANRARLAHTTDHHNGQHRLGH